VGIGEVMRAGGIGRVYLTGATLILDRGLTAG
jgi:hypothetical protein